MLLSSMWLGRYSFKIKKRDRAPLGVQKMTIELTKEMALHLVGGLQPNYDKFTFLENFGTYSDQYGRFYWNFGKLREMSLEELYELYNISR